MPKWKVTVRPHKNKCSVRTIKEELLAWLWMLLISFSVFFYFIFFCLFCFWLFVCCWRCSFELRSNSILLLQCWFLYHFMAFKWTTTAKQKWMAIVRIQTLKTLDIFFFLSNKRLKTREIVLLFFSYSNSA